MSDEAIATRDAPPVDQGQPSAASGEQTSTQPRTYTEEEFRAAQNRASDKLAEAGRKHKSDMASMTAQITESQGRVSSLIAQIEEMEDKGITNPDGKQVLADKRELRRLRAELAGERANLAQEKAQWESERAELQQARLLKKAQAIARDFEGVDPEDLVTLTDGSDERMEALAKRLGKPRQPAPPKATGTPTTTPISEQGAGGMSDDAFWIAAATYPGKYSSPADIKRLREIQGKRDRGG